MRDTKQSGYILLTAIIAIAILMITMMLYSSLSITNMRTSQASTKSGEGFYASEAGLGVRANEIRKIFASSNTPDGTSPSRTGACTDENKGTKDFACISYSLNSRTVNTYVEVGASKPGRIPIGDDFENLNAIETPYTVVSSAMNAQNNPEAITNMIFRSRLVPLFQFAVFFDKDLEFSNTAALDLSGPVHTNKNLFLDSALTLRGQVTAGGNIYDGWKSQDKCIAGTTFVKGNSTRDVTCNGSRTTLITALNATLYDKQLKKVRPVRVPTIGDIQPVASGTYWSKADVRVVLKGTMGGSWTPYFVTADGTVISGLNSTNSCNASVSAATGFRDNREASNWDNPAFNVIRRPVVLTSTARPRSNKVLLDIDVPQLLSCIHQRSSTLGIADGLQDKTDDGLVIYATVDDSPETTILTKSLRNTLGPATSTNMSQSNPPVVNNYGVRLKNGATLAAAISGAPKPKGVTFVTDQAAFIQGSFNQGETRTAGWVPSSVLADSVNVLSNAWNVSQVCRRGSLYANPNLYSWREEFDPNEADGSSMYDWAFLGNTWRLYDRQLPYRVPLNTNSDAKSQNPLFCRLATPTTIRTALMAGTAVTGEELRLYNDANMGTSGGVHNMMRFHEEWGQNGRHPDGAQTFTYEGSLVSLSTPLHSNGQFYLDKMRFYSPPYRSWSYDTKFNDQGNLPPLTPRFVTIKQENFTRQFSQ